MSTITNGNGAPKIATEAARDGAAKKEPSPFGLERDQWGQMVFIGEDGPRQVNVELIPLFPISVPESWVSIRSAEGTELACIENPSKLPAEMREMLKEELSRREFVPEIRRIVRVSGNS